MPERYPSQTTSMMPPPPSSCPPMPPSNGFYPGNPACGCCCGDEGCCCAPRFCRPAPTPENQLQLCCDANGCCCYYPARCRNPYWPEFTHPRWLCCTDLYDGKSESCYSCCPEEPEDADCAAE